MDVSSSVNPHGIINLPFLGLLLSVSASSWIVEIDGLKGSCIEVIVSHGGKDNLSTDEALCTLFFSLLWNRKLDSKIRILMKWPTCN